MSLATAIRLARSAMVLTVAGWLVACGVGHDPEAADAERLRPQVQFPVETGLWWDACQPGRGFGIELQGNTVFLTAYGYEASGSATWHAGSLQREQGSRFTGSLESYRNGQAIGGSYRAPDAPARAASATLDFQSSRSAMLTVTPVDSGTAQTVSLVRFTTSTGADATGPVGPESGYWWNPARSGRGFMLDVQGSTAVLVSYLYETTGAPAWYLLTGRTAGPTVASGRLEAYADGQTLTGPWRPARALPGSPGPVVWTAVSSNTASLQWPNGEVEPLQRLDFATTAATVAGKRLYFQHCAMCHGLVPAENKDRVLSGANAPDYILATILRSTFGMGYLFSVISEQDAAYLATFLANPRF